MSSDLKSPISFMMGAYADNPNSVILQAVSFLFLGYMSICTYWSIFRINISWAYQLQGPQLSPPSSLLFNGEYLSRLQFAFGYNFPVSWYFTFSLEFELILSLQVGSEVTHNPFPEWKNSVRWFNFPVGIFRSGLSVF